MSLKNKIKNFFFLEEEYDDEEEQYNRRPDRPTPAPSTTFQPAIKKTIKERRAPIAETPQNVVNFQQASKTSKVILVEPRVYAETQDISEHLKSKRIIIVNLHRLDREQATRVIDFLSGTTYALGGEICRIGEKIFLCSPDTVDVAGTISSGEHYYDDLN